jgi:hypothetical protein
MTSQDRREILMVPVPAEHYQAVILFLAQLMGGNVPPGNVEVGWARDDVRRLMLEPLNPTIRALLDLTCEKPETPVTLIQIQRRAETEYGQARGQLASFTKLLRKRFGRTDWPVRFEQGADGKLHYTASQEFAEAWNAKHATQMVTRRTVR